MEQLIFLLVFLGSIIFMINRRSKVAEGQISSEPLTSREKFLTWIVCLLNPLIAGAILFHGWKKKLPQKAKQANKISFIAFAISLIIAGGWLALLQSQSITQSSTSIVSYHSNEYQFTIDFPEKPKIEKSGDEKDFSASHRAGRILKDGTVIYFVNVAGQANSFTPNDFKSIPLESVADADKLEPLSYQQTTVNEHIGAKYEYKVHYGNQSMTLKGMILLDSKTNRMYDVGILFDDTTQSYTDSNYQSYIDSFSLQ